jgi:ClpP class serine protease
MSAPDAKKYGLIDKLGDFEFAKKELAKLCNLPYQNLNVIKLNNNMVNYFMNELNIFFRNPFENTSKVEYKFNGL